MYLEKFSLILQSPDSYIAIHSTQNFRMIHKMVLLRASLPLLRPIKIYSPPYKNIPGKQKVQNLPWVKKQYHFNPASAKDLTHSLFLRKSPKTKTPITKARK